MKRFIDLMIRELRLLSRNYVALLILFGGPLFFGLLIGYVYVDSKVTDLPIIVVDLDHSSLSENITDALDDNQFMKVIEVTYDEFKAHEALKTQKVWGVVTIPKGFEANIQQKRHPEIQCDLNSINILTANYVNTGMQKTLGTINAAIEINTLQKKGMPYNIASEQFESFRVNYNRFYNAESNYLKFLWPGILGAVLQQIFLLVIALIFAQEFELKRFGEVISYSKSATFIMFAKSIPYIILMSLIWFGIIGFMFPLFRIEILGSSLDLIVFSMLFLISLLFMGVMVSLIFASRLTSTEVLMIIASPSFIISGYTWPVSQMPAILQHLANILPLTHFLSGFRKIAFMGNNLSDVSSEIHSLLIFTIVTAVISVILLKIRIYFENKRLNV